MLAGKNNIIYYILVSTAGPIYEVATSLMYITHGIKMNNIHAGRRDVWAKHLRKEDHP
jgi:hypothetical protein